MSSVIGKYEVELSSLNLSESQKESVMRMLLSTFEKGGAKSGEEFGSCVAETFVKGGKGGVKGRPSKSKKVVETGGESDVFEQLLSMGLEDPPLVKEDSVATLPVATLVVAPEGLLAPPFPKVEKSEKLAATNAKSAEKAAKAAEKQAAKDAKEAEKAAAIKAKEEAKQAVIDAKLAKEAEKEAAKQAVIDAKLAKESEKEAAKQAVIDAKLAKEAEKAATIKAKEDAKLAKEAEKEAKAAAKLAKEAEKEAKKAEKDAKKAANPPLKKVEPKKKAVKSTVESAPSTEETPNAVEPVASAAPEESLAPPLSKVDSPAVRVKKFSFEGVKYLKDTAGTIYDLASQDRIGVWNEEEKKIVFDAKGDAEEEDECSEEEYEGEDA